MFSNRSNCIAPRLMPSLPPAHPCFRAVLREIVEVTVAKGPRAAAKTCLTRANQIDSVINLSAVMHDGAVEWMADMEVGDVDLLDMRDYLFRRAEELCVAIS